jgi:multidrug transporter EmrE-like cation transporter
MAGPGGLWPSEAGPAGPLTRQEACPRDRTIPRPWRSGTTGIDQVTLSGFLQLAASTAVFLVAATVAKSWALAPGLGKLVLTLLLYSAGNLIMLRLVREFGMASAFSLSAVIQLVAVNVIALAWFGEHLTMLQSAGIVLAIVAVALITLGPAFGK